MKVLLTAHLSRLLGLITIITPAYAQSYTVLHQFGSITGDGARPSASLMPVGSTLYGTTAGNEYGSGGSVFALNTDDSNYTNLHSFAGSDGLSPRASLTVIDSTLYGTTELGGDNDAGTVFALNTDGSGFRTLHHFAGSPTDGARSRAALIVIGSRLYGTTLEGGDPGFGTVFSLNVDGSGYSVLHHFGSVVGDGRGCASGLKRVGSKLYGTTIGGGSHDLGTIFRLNTNGSHYEILHDFAGYPSDGAASFTALIRVGRKLFGTTAGSPSNSTVFVMNPKGTRYSILHRFIENTGDGVWPFADLTLIRTTLYGTASYGGTNTLNGTVFALNTDGSNYSIQHDFAGSPYDGAAPLASLTVVGSALYGTTSSGGMYSNGTAFMLAP